MVKYALAFTCLLAAWAAHATPQGDPICRTPSSLDLVSVRRAQNLNPAATKFGPFRPSQAGVSPLLSLSRPGVAAPARLTLGGAAGQAYQIETTSDLGGASWNSWLSVILGGEPLSWDADSASQAPRQFFRLRAGQADPLADAASTFRLLDAEGVAHDLYYHSNLEGIVVLAAGPSLEPVVPLVPLLDELAAIYGEKIQIWILLSDPSGVRSNVLVQAKAGKINFPVLLDPEGLAARSVGLTHAGEVALVKPPEFTVAYRGEVTDGTTTSAAKSFLGQALEGVHSAQPIKFLRTPARGAELAHVALGTPDYTRDIAPIFYQHCATCHRSDGVAPFAMTNHSVVRDWSPVIKHAVLSGQMPPWHADPEHNKFTNNLSLPRGARSALVRWIDAGSPRGLGADPLAELPAPPAFGEWPPELGEPDALVTIPVQPIKAEGSEPYRYIFTTSPNTSNVWLKAAILRPSNYRAVHHLLVWPGHIGNSGAPDSSTYQSHIAEFVPGNKPFLVPSDAYIPLSRSNKLTFNLHYTPYGVATNDQPTLALWYHKTKPKKTWGVAAIGPANLNIPPMESDHQIQNQITIPIPITIYRFNPHMHVRGKRARYELILPNGTRETLLSVPDYDFNWQIGYDLETPKSIPAGSKILVTMAYDNSPQNLSNPDPTATVIWGDQSWMEMFVGYMDYTQ